MAIILTSSGMLTWLLIAAGLVILSAGAWAVSRARRYEDDTKHQRQNDERKQE